MWKKLFLYCLLFIPYFLSAQRFGGNPPSLKWKQLNSDTARIIFPVGLDSQAQRVSSIVHFLAANNNTLGSRLQIINIVLQNQTTIANAYVNLGPYRSEFFMTPTVDNFELGSIDWPASLAVHEYRHVQQFSNFKTGLSKAMYYLFGEDGLALAINAAVPDWFYEGDAVYNETVHTEQGRGRLPYFLNQYKSLSLENKNYRWMKLRNGSLKDYVPSHYPLGYLMVNYGYEKYGIDFWKKVTQDAAAYKGLFYPFQHAIKKQANVDYKTFREDAFKFNRGPHQTSPQGGGLEDFNKVDISLIKKKDQSELQKINGASQEKLNQGPLAGEINITTATKNFVTNYFFPFQLADDSLLVLKSSYRKRPVFVIKDNAGEHRLRVKDISLDDYFSYRSGKIIYAAYETDARWGWRDYSVIRVLDIHSGVQKKLTHKTKYFTPDISDDGEKVVAVDMAATGKSELHILDAASGAVLQRISSPEIGVFTGPKFIDNNNVVTAVRLTDGRMELDKVDIATGAIQRLTPPSFNVMGFLNVYKNKIYFTASFAGNDDLYAYDLSENKIYRLTKDVLGNYFVNVKDDQAIYSSFSADGYQLMQMNLKANEKSETKLTEEVTNYPVARANEYSKFQLSAIPPRSFNSSAYKKSTRLLNFHSWRPDYSDPEFTFTLYGQNVLNTLQTELYYLYNQNEKTNSVGFNTAFGSLFPYITAGTEYTIGRTDSVNRKLREWNQLDTRIGLNIPLNFSGGRFYRNLNFGSSFVLRNETNTGPDKNNFAENNFSYLSHFINYSQSVQKARQHIYPRLGYSVSLQYRNAVNSNNSYQFFSSGNIYLPGFFSTHSIVLNGSFQQRDTLKPGAYSNRFAYSRGYNDFYFSRMWKLGANYHFPVWIPDWGFGNMLYIQRIRANMFYDFTKVYSRNKKNTLNQRSSGVEFYFDTKWWNQYPLTFGFRISHLLDKDLQTGNKGNYFEFILPVSIISK